MFSFLLFLTVASITASDAVASANVVAAVFGVIANFVASVATISVAVAAVVLVATIVVNVAAPLETAAMQNFFRPLKCSQTSKKMDQNTAGMGSIPQNALSLFVF